jgi:hypothetical protein
MPAKKYPLPIINCRRSVENRPDPQLTEQLDALSEKFDEAYNNNDAAALAALWLFRRYAFGCRRILAMLDPQGWLSGLMRRS